MNRSQYIIVFFLVSGMASRVSAQVQTLTLAEALRVAQQHQPQLQQARANNEMQLARKSQALSPLLPQIVGSAAYQRSTANVAARPGSIPQSIASATSSTSNTYDYFNFGLSASQVLFDFSQFEQWRAARANAEAQQHNLRATESEVAYAVQIAYFAAQAQRALLQVAQASLANRERHLGQIVAFVEVGRRPEIDLAQARADKANAQVQLINAENAYATAKARLNQAIGVEQSVNYDVSHDVLAPVEGEARDTDALLHEALKSRAEFTAIDRQLRALTLQLRAIKGTYGPTLNASTSLTEAGGSLDAMRWNWNIGLNLTWTLFQGGLTYGRQREANANLTALKAQLATLRQQVRLDVEQARLAVHANKAATIAAQEALIHAQKRLNLAAGRYENGVGNIIELSDAQLALTNAEAQRVQADFNVSTARAQLLRALGRHF